MDSGDDPASDEAARKVELQKKSRSKASIAPIPTRLMKDYICEMQVRLREKKIGYKKEFLREIIKEIRESVVRMSD